MAEFLNNIANRAGTTVNNIAGNLIGDITGLPSEDIPLYENFLYNILSDAENAVTESSYWVVFFDQNPTGSDNETISSSISSIISNAIGSYISQFGIGGLTKNVLGEPNNLEATPWRTGEKSTALESNFWDNVQNTMMLVQGIEIPGDGFSISRQGADNVGGFLRAPITGIRNDLPEMEITFLENNSSVTDLVLRPWVIHSSYASLKFAKSCTVTCYNLTRSPSGFRIRKKFMFHNAVPTYIDAEQYQYTAGTSYGKRQTKFVFTHYSVEDGDAMRDSLLGSVANFALQATRRFVTGVVETGVDVIAGGANQVLTNVVGGFVDTVQDHLLDVQTRVREAGQAAEDSIIDNAQRQIDQAIGYDPQKDSIQRGPVSPPSDGVDNNPSPRIEVVPSGNDSIEQSPVPPKGGGVANDVTYTPVKINEDDTVDSSALNLQQVNINSNEGGLDISPVESPNDDNIRR